MKILIILNYKEHGDGYQVIMVMDFTFGPSHNPKPPCCHAFDHLQYAKQREKCLAHIICQFMGMTSITFNNLGRKTGEGAPRMHFALVL